MSERDVVCTQCVYTVVASRSAVSDAPRAKRLGRASVGTSISGIVVSVFVVAIVLVVLLIAAPDCNYNYLGTCYRYKTYVGYSGYCSGVKSSDGYCYSD